MHEEIKSRLNSENACYHSVQCLLSSRLLCRNLKVKIYKTVILWMVLYGCETWSLTLREEHRRRVFENRVLRLFGPKRDEVMGECRMLHNGELHNLYSSPDIIRQQGQWGGQGMWQAGGEGGNLYRVLVRKPEGKRPLERRRRRWEDGSIWILGRLVGGCGVDSPVSG
jgi:hypothetical protein